LIALQPCVLKLRMNGTSKARTHRLLNPRFELSQLMPDLQHNQASKIIANIKRKDRALNQDVKNDGMHPCASSHVSYMMCMRRYPDSYLKQCDTQASKHANCIKTSEFWKPEREFDHMQFLENFKIFGECRRFKKTDAREILRQGATAAIQFKP